MNAGIDKVPELLPRERPHLRRTPIELVDHVNGYLDIPIGLESGVDSALCWIRQRAAIRRVLRNIDKPRT
ncbi:MAG TPA: hypothetical protein VK550_01855 [Polyangiaceae bacterium]|nr:hypothetical protein [Polyangiaceae bacterium]